MSAGQGAREFDVLRSLAGFMGVAGTGGGGFAALAFGIGFLAIQSRDRMLGLPTSVVTTTDYVRTGALFFTNSVNYLLTEVMAYACLVVALAAVTAVAWWSRSYRVAYFASFALVVGLGFSVIIMQASVLAPINTELLQKAVAGTSVAAGPAEEGDPAAAAFAERVRSSLTDSAGSQWLKGQYAMMLFLVLTLIYGTIVLSRWTFELKLTGVSAGLVQFLLQPVVYFVAAAALIGLPGAYGVLCMPKNGQWVVVAGQDRAGKDRSEAGYILSDLSTGTAEVWLLGFDQGNSKWELYALERQKIREIRLTGDTTPNILAPIQVGRGEGT